MSARSDLELRREQLADRLAELQWDLGGLAYEMAIRDHFRLDVLLRVAARLQETDSELGEVERLLHLDDSGAAGSCPKCAALYGRGAAYCWRCGEELMEPLHASEAGSHDAGRGSPGGNRKSRHS